jgi:RHS repeat-associated protein
MLLTEEGYVDLSASTPTYYYYLKDHQGNNRVVINSAGVVQETNHYYPFGGVFASTNVQPYKYNGKELDTKKGLNWYDYGARHYDATLGRWFVVDPLAEKMSAWSLYAYCFNNPIKLIDKDGKIPGPGDLFATKKEAAKDWGKYYNGASIIREKEMASTIYEVRVNGVLVGYSYSKPNEGSAHSVNPSSPPNYEKVSGTIHSHGNADSDSYNNIFSTKDIQDIEKTKKVGYLATPSGSLLQYDPVTNKTTTISKELPSDPKDKERVNNINPTDIPAEKERQVLKELHKHFNLYFSLWKNETIKWFIE